jgi:RNA polymerase sigma-70 factor (ECF subfamily)
VIKLSARSHLRPGPVHEDILALPHAREPGPVDIPGERSGEKGEARLRRMVETHHDPLWRFMRRLGVDARDLDDAMQEVVVVAASRLESIPASSEKAFLFGTALRIAAEWRRFRERRREDDDAGLSDHEAPVLEADALVDQARARTMLDDVLRTMPLDLRAVFTLYEIEELTMSEIAELLQLPSGTVASRLRRGREHFEAEVLRLQARMKRTR